MNLRQLKTDHYPTVDYMMGFRRNRKKAKNFQAIDIPSFFFPKEQKNLGKEQ